ncbi:MAG TPA: SH3-like domain-containing protein [Thermohalobaculum sp.]|nr:SH3-like domain-containing protein [Thermohalobaculum sp.]
MTLPEVTPPNFPPPYPVGATRFAAGDAVRVRAADGPGHLRTPWYVRGRQGRVERICGAFGNPEELAYGRDGAVVPLYRVRFRMDALWGASAERGDDTLDVEIFEHWLEPA